jgi:hypothetical protein
VNNLQLGFVLLLLGCTALLVSYAGPACTAGAAGFDLSPLAGAGAVETFLPVGCSVASPKLLSFLGGGVAVGAGLVAYAFGLAEGLEEQPVAR